MRARRLRSRPALEGFGPARRQQPAVITADVRMTLRRADYVENDAGSNQELMRLQDYAAIDGLICS